MKILKALPAAKGKSDRMAVWMKRLIDVKMQQKLRFACSNFINSDWPFDSVSLDWVGPPSHRKPFAGNFGIIGCVLVSISNLIKWANNFMLDPQHMAQISRKAQNLSNSLNADPPSDLASKSIEVETFWEYNKKKKSNHMKQKPCPFVKLVTALKCKCVREIYCVPLELRAQDISTIFGVNPISFAIC